MSKFYDVTLRGTPYGNKGKLTVRVDEGGNILVRKPSGIFSEKHNLSPQAMTQARALARNKGFSYQNIASLAQENNKHNSAWKTRYAKYGKSGRSK